VASAPRGPALTLPAGRGTLLRARKFGAGGWLMTRLRSVVALALAGAFGASAAAQDLDPTGFTGLDRPEDVIYARQLLMLEIEALFYPVYDLLDAELPIDLATTEAGMAGIASLLQVAPHLFPSTTNLADRPLELPTIALPAIWQDFDTFYALFGQAAALARTAAYAPDLDSFRAAATEVRAACEGCHAAYTVPYEDPFAAAL